MAIGLVGFLDSRLRLGRWFGIWGRRGKRAVEMGAVAYTLVPMGLVVGYARPDLVRQDLIQIWPNLAQTWPDLT